MPNSSLGAKPSAEVAGIGEPGPPVPQEYGATIASGSLLVSLAAFTVAGISFLRSRKLERGARFESAFGAPVREELRSFQRIVLKMKAFAFPAGKSVEELKSEFENLRVELEEASNGVGILLRELDQARTVKGSGWEASFTRSTSRAEEIMQAVAHPRVSTEAAFRAKAEDARTLYQRSIDDIRSLLDAERAKV